MMHRTAAAALPLRAGIGLKPEHFREILETRPHIGFFEVHAENYMVAGGPFHHYLERIRSNYPLSIHGVGLSIGGTDPLDIAHMNRLDALLKRYQPESFSEHLAWSSHGGQFYNDLLPLPYTSETLERVCRHINQVQERLSRPMLLENPATYVEFSASTMSEGDFISEVIRRTGCGLLLDVSNLYISAINHGRDTGALLDELPLAAVGQMHLAGFAEDLDSSGERLLIDSHGCAVAQAIWALYERALARTGAQPTLLERDNDIPPLGRLLAEAAQAEKRLQIAVLPEPICEIAS